MTGLIKLLYWKAISLRNKFCNLKFKVSCNYQSLRFRGQIKFCSNVNIWVPVRNDGCGSVYISDNVTLGFSKAPRLGSGEILLQSRNSDAQIQIGVKTTFSNNVSVIANQKVNIGSRCQIGELVSIYDSDFHEINPNARNQSSGAVESVNIGDNVWLGSRVLVLKGVTIGNNSVIAAGSIVNKDIPENCLAAGIPAKVIKRI